LVFLYELRAAIFCIQPPCGFCCYQCVWVQLHGWRGVHWILSRRFAGRSPGNERANTFCAFRAQEHQAAVSSFRGDTRRIADCHLMERPGTLAAPTGIGHDRLQRNSRRIQAADRASLYFRIFRRGGAYRAQKNRRQSLPSRNADGVGSRPKSCCGPTTWLPRQLRRDNIDVVP